MEEIKWPMVRCARCGQVVDSRVVNVVQDLVNNKYYCPKCFKKMKKETGVSTIREQIEREQAEKARQELPQRQPSWLGRNGYWFGGILVILAGAAVHWFAADELFQKWGLAVMGIGVFSVVCYFLKRFLEKKGIDWL